VITYGNNHALSCYDSSHAIVTLLQRGKALKVPVDGGYIPLRGEPRWPITQKFGCSGRRHRHGSWNSATDRQRASLIIRNRRNSTVPPATSGRCCSPGLSRCATPSTPASFRGKKSIGVCENLREHNFFVSQTPFSEYQQVCRLLDGSGESATFLPCMAFDLI
jgi:hypothetical protein